MEVLIITAMIAVMSTVGLFAAQKQIDKGRDAKRKGDLHKIKHALEEYYNDKGCYHRT